MTETLALRYRPATFADLAGQPMVTTVLTAVVDAHRAGTGAPATFLFSGPPGTGKTSTARMLAAALNAPEGYAWDMAAIVEVDAATNNGVDHVRSLVQSTEYAVTTRHRTIVLDECHAFTEEAWQALLKALEAPPPATSWVLVTTEPAQVPDAVLSRCVDLHFRAIDSEAILGRLVAICQAEQLGAEVDALRLVARRASGGMRDAVMALDRLRLAGPVTVAAYEALYGVGMAAPAYLAAITGGDLPGALGIASAYAAGTGEPELLVDEVLELLAERLAAGTDVRATVAATRKLWEVRARLRSHPLGARAAIGAVTAELVDALGVRLHIHGDQTPAPAPPVDLAAVLGGNNDLTLRKP